MERGCGRVGQAGLRRRRCVGGGPALAANADPSLRNVTRRQVFFHNGRFQRLQDVVRFYARRDTHPELFYPRRADGSVDRFDDLPDAYKANVAHADPALSDTEVDDVVAFLKTLTDRVNPPATASTSVPSSAPSR